MSKTTYYCQVEGMIHGSHRKVNEELQLSDSEAKYLVMAGLIGKTKKAGTGDRILATEPAPATLEMKTRKS